MTEISANRMFTFYPEQTLKCQLPKGTVKLTLTPTKSNEGWSVIVSIFDGLKQNKQTIEFKDFTRHNIGYFTSSDEEKRYPGVNLKPSVEKDHYGFFVDEVLISFRQTKEKDALEIRCGVDCIIEKK